MSHPKPTKEQEEALKNVLEDEEVAEYVGLKGKICNSTHFRHTSADCGWAAFAVTMLVRKGHFNVHG